MLAPWSFSVLLLGSILGSPLYRNGIQNRASDHVVPDYPNNPKTNSSNSTLDCEGPSCGSFQNYTGVDSEQNSTSNSPGIRLLSQGLPPEKLPSRLKICFLPTCAVHHLGEKLQTGDEIAGDTNDPFGVGKR